MNEKLQQILAEIKSNGLEWAVFMELYRNSDELNEQMSADDCVEVFTGILKGAEDLSFDLFDNVCHEYDVDIVELMVERAKEVRL